MTIFTRNPLAALLGTPGCPAARRRRRHGVDELGAVPMGFLEWARTVTISGQIGGNVADLIASGGTACTMRQE
jgi:hypothetical protein